MMLVFSMMSSHRLVRPSAGGLQTKVEISANIIILQYCIERGVNIHYILYICMYNRTRTVRVIYYIYVYSTCLATSFNMLNDMLFTLPYCARSLVIMYSEIMMFTRYITHVRTLNTCIAYLIIYSIDIVDIMTHDY